MPENTATVIGMDKDPDPSVLSTQLVVRENLWLRELLETRLDAMDKALSLFRTGLEKVPSEVDIKVGNLATLMDEKFRGVQLQFTERDTRVEGQSKDSKVAVDAALSAAKEAVGAAQLASDRAIAKSELTTTKSIDGISELLAAGNRVSDSRLSDLKERLDRIEGNSHGQAATISMIFAAIGCAGAVLGIAGGLAALLR